MFKKRKDNEVDVGSLNEILYIGRRLIQIVYVVTIIILIVLGTYLLKEWKIIGIIKEILVVISPIFIGFLIAWLFDPAVTFLHKKKVPRIVGCIIVYVVLLSGLALLLYLFLPMFSQQIKDFVGTIPDIVADLKSFMNSVFDKFRGSIVDVDTVKNQLYLSIEEFGNELTNNLPNYIINVGKSIISAGIFIVFGLMLGFYMLYDFDKLNKGLLKLVPKKWHAGYKELTSRINSSLRSYVQGVLMVMFLVFITQAIGLTIAGISAPMIFALFCAITDIIPYFGPYIGAIPAVVVGFTISPFVGVAVIVAIVIVQQLENNFYQPLIMGHTMKLHPVTIMLGLLIFEHFFGIIGMIVATPCIACLKVIFLFINEKKNILELENKEEKNDKKELAESN